MRWFERRRRAGRRVALIGLDGTPYTYLARLLAEGHLPHLGRLLREGTMVPMTSVLPTVSCVAWTSIVTGTNPGKHGIYGFVERQPDGYGIYVNTSAHVRRETLWDLAGRGGKRAIVVNVPNTYPPRPLHGILVSGFETPDLVKAAYPPAEVGRLQRLGYRIDIDAWLARRSREALLEELRQTIDRRTATFLELLGEEWDLFVGVYMETDRLHHFLWEQMERGHPLYAPAFLDLYRRLDAAIGEIARRLEDDRTVLVVLSDHGFCTLRREVFVNTWLREQGWLELAGPSPTSLEAIGPGTRAYSLDPGRLYLNLRGREPRGVVEAGEYEAARAALAAALAGLTDPETHEPVVTRVYRREELYRGPYVAQAPDLVVHTRDGYEAKGAVNRPALFGRDEIEGMHTTENALLLVRGARVGRSAAHVTDAVPTVLTLLDLPLPPDLDGQPLALP